MGVNFYGMTEPISVVSAVIRRGDAVLLAQRRATQDEPLKWEFPGGKIELGESPQQGLVRELSEELGITVEVGPLYQTVLHDYPDRTIHLMAFLGTLLAGTPRPLDCEAVRWVPIKLLRDYDLCAADLPIASRLTQTPM